MLEFKLLTLTFARRTSRIVIVTPAGFDTPNASRQIAATVNP